MRLNEVLTLRRKLVMFDLETTSLDTSVARIIQISLRAHAATGEELKRFTTLVDPGIPITNSEAHGITDEVIREGCALCKQPRSLHPLTNCEKARAVPTWQEIGGIIYKGFHDADFGGKNIRYDLEVIRSEFKRLNLEFDYSQALRLDADRLWQLLEPRTLSHAVEHFLGRKHKGAHDAMCDIEETEEVIIAQLTKHKNSTDLKRNLVDLHEQCYPRDKDGIDSEGKFKFVNNVAVLNFGKKTKRDGTPLRGLPLSDPDVLSYLKWMVGAEFSPEVKRIASDALNGRFPTRS